MFSVIISLLLIVLEGSVVSCNERPSKSCLICMKVYLWRLNALNWMVLVYHRFPACVNCKEWCNKPDVLPIYFSDFLHENMGTYQRQISQLFDSQEIHFRRNHFSFDKIWFHFGRIGFSWIVSKLVWSRYALRPTLVESSPPVRKLPCVRVRKHDGSLVHLHIDVTSLYFAVQIRFFCMSLISADLCLCGNANRWCENLIWI